MFIYPHIDPVAVRIGSIPIYWYGIMYVIGFLMAGLLGMHRARSKYYVAENWSTDDVSDLIFYAAIGVLLGGRIGYMLFYNFSHLIHDPLSLFKIRQGGMSFHGGLMGVMLACYFFGKNKNKTFFQVTDFLAPLVPLGLAAGRIGNFINGELWGRVTTVPWGIVYPQAGPLPRHPSQIYEFLLEGILLFTVLWLYARKPKPCMATSGLFLVLYGSFRCFAEFFRQPDPQLGFIAMGWLTMGQLLSIPMIIMGSVLLTLATKKNKNENEAPSTCCQQ